MLFIRADWDDLGNLYEDPVGIWKTWADSVQEAVLDCGHHMAEEAPDELSAAIARFLSTERPTYA